MGSIPHGEIRYLPEQGLLSKVMAAYRQGRLAGKIALKLRQAWRILRSTRYAVSNPARNVIALHCPDYVQPEAADRELVERIFHAFKAMKADQPRQADCYAPAPMWQVFLDRAYSHLNRGARDNDLDTFHFFLANFGTWKEYTAVESSTRIRNGMRSFLGRAHLQNDMFGRQLEFWRWFYNGRKPVSALTYPTYGNQSGAYISGVFVGMGAFFNEIYGTLLAEMVRGRQRPVIAELGAGYGKLAFFTLRNLDRFAYVDFDLPETLTLAAYYLMKVYPKTRVLLYGEDDYSPDAHDKYDLIFMPSWAIERAGESTVNLFMNKNSLGEMDGEAVRNYVRCIARATRYFFHMNHERVPADVSGPNTGLLGSDYPLPADQFRLLFRYPEVGHLLFHEGEADFRMDIFLYLYERMKP